ncbi:hypothetical protein [uncultured Brevundimonas sp.]|uniref:hypothetical protein n=1 Tax=uncultured Brevundimonas sp. TaxID=213418 RepID=UPI00261DA957|nr:hypothetical protein [uncultured Brevundimonas sp.]
MSRLTVLKTSEAQAVVYEAEALERETRRETERWQCDAQDLPTSERFEESQARYWELREAAGVVVDLLYRMQEPLRTDPYAIWAAKMMGKAKTLLTDIEDGQLVEKISLVPASSEKE